MKKFPWYMTDCVTISQRQAIFSATCELLRLLRRSIDRSENTLNLTPQLFERVVTAAMGCPGFTPLMKDDIAYIAKLTETRRREMGQPRLAHAWRHLYALSPKPGVPLDVIEVSIT